SQTKTPKKQRPPQRQKRQPGTQGKMRPKPILDDPNYHGCGNLGSRVALITGGDSGIGAATAIAYAKEGADVVVVYLREHTDAKETAAQVNRYGRECLLIAGDISSSAFCARAVKRAISHFG